jgi:hypothetical protein
VKQAGIIVEHEGKQVTLAQLSKVTGLPYMTLYLRWRAGDRGEDLCRPSRRKGSVTKLPVRTAPVGPLVSIAGMRLPTPSDPAFARLVQQWNEAVFPWVDWSTARRA